MYFTWDQLILIGLLGALFALLVSFFTATPGDGKRRPWCLPWLPIVGSLPFLGSMEHLGSYFMTQSKRRGNVLAFYAGKRSV
jgi:hypothetical protein